MNIVDTEKTLNYLLDNNLKLIEQGLDKIAVCIEGEAGIGKTAIVKQIAEKRGCRYTKICLSELEEVGDLVGIPQKEYLMTNPDGKERWVTEKTINQYINMGYELCPHCLPRMSYSVPAWVPDDPEAESILFLDDFSRASTLFMQAIMSLIQFGEYVSWHLPKRTHLILSSNPDDGNYSVSSLDAAQQSRLITLNVEFDVKPYAKWAENVGLRGEFINFALLNSEIFERSKVVNARSYTLFANALNSIKDLASPDSMAMANMIAKGAFGNDGEYIGGMFVQFINNKLDKLITPEQMLTGDWEAVCKKLTQNVYRDDLYRADIGSVLTLRFINYVEKYFNEVTDKDASTKAIERVVKMVTYKDDKDRVLLTSDLILKLVKSLYSKFPRRFEKMIGIPEVRNMLLGA